MQHQARIPSLILLAALSGAALCLPARAAEPVAGNIVEMTEVVAVEVPVQVVRDGEPVRGLTAADFEIWDGRRKVPVTGFEVLDLDVVDTPGTSETRKPALPISARRHFLRDGPALLRCLPCCLSQRPGPGKCEPGRRAPSLVRARLLRPGPAPAPGRAGGA